MATGSVRYPDDAANTGPREGTRTRTEDAVTKHFPRFIEEAPRTTLGVYHYHSGALTVQASAHGAGAGFFWLINPSASGVLLAVRRIRFVSQFNAVLAAPTAPRIVLERFTYTGTASGAQITAAKRRTADAAAACTWRTANTGMTQTAGAVIASWLPTGSQTAVGVSPATYDEVVIPQDEQVVLDPSVAAEGIRCYQADAGTASDTRRFTIDIIAEEFTDF